MADPFARVRGVVFDLDGTLIDSRGDIAAACNHALGTLGLPAHSTEVIASFVGDGARALCARAARLDESDPIVDRLIAGYVAYYVEHPADFTRWMPGALELVARLSEGGRLLLAVCTNKPRAPSLAVLGALGAPPALAVLVAGDDSAERKPAPGPVLAAARGLGLPAEELVMVGDGPMDILAGRRAGARTVGLTSGFFSRGALEREGPDALLDALLELPALLAARPPPPR